MNFFWCFVVVGPSNHSRLQQPHDANVNKTSSLRSKADKKTRVLKISLRRKSKTIFNKHMENKNTSFSVLIDTDVHSLHCIISLIRDGSSSSGYQVIVASIFTAVPLHNAHYIVFSECVFLFHLTLFCPSQLSLTLPDH